MEKEVRKKLSSCPLLVSIRGGVDIGVDCPLKAEIHRFIVANGVYTDWWKEMEAKVDRMRAGDKVPSDVPIGEVPSARR